MENAQEWEWKRKRQGSLCTVKRPREVHDNTKRETSHVAWRRATRGHYLVPVVRALPSKHGPSVGRAALGQRSIHVRRLVKGAFTCRRSLNTSPPGPVSVQIMDQGVSMVRPPDATF